MESNFADGIARMMNNKNLYIRLLVKFQSTDNLGSLCTAVAAGDQERIKMEAHTLKGVAANLGLVGLSAKATALDQAVKEGHMDQLQELLEQIKASYETTMEEISQYIAS